MNGHVSTQAMFLIESGKALDLARIHLAEVTAVSDQVRALARELGVERYTVSKTNGVVLSVTFAGQVHPDFSKTYQHQRGRPSYRPKRGTQWATRFAAQKGYGSASDVIAGAFGIPLSLSYGRDGSGGTRLLGIPGSECGFLYPRGDGPYAMWVPDVPAEVGADESRGLTVADPARSFQLEFEGCRRIGADEWEILGAHYAPATSRAGEAAV